MTAEAIEALPAQLARIEAVLSAIQRGNALSVKPILSTAEAMELAGYTCDSAFYRWATTWGVRKSGQGRWARHRIQAALEKESNSAPRLRGKADRKTT